MSDGISYDLFAIVNAVLDRIDGATTMSEPHPTCSGCGQPILDGTCVEWNGRYYHNIHIPMSPPFPPENRAVLRALQLIRDRALGNDRKNVTLGDIEWTIQEIERG